MSVFRMLRTLSATLTILASCLPVAVRAEGSAAALLNAVRVDRGRPPAFDLPRSADQARDEALAKAGVARTAVDRRLGAEGLTGSAGFLCDRAPGHNEHGGMSAYGYDPHGRFVGARLSLAFR